MTVEKELQRDLTGKQLSGLLESCGLPPDYNTRTSETRRKLRLKVLSSWYDPRQPHILCTDVEAMVKAFRLWCHFFIYPSEFNRGTYYFSEPTNKYDMIRLVMSPPLIATEPAMSVVTATRRVGKTQTLIIELKPFLAICRPYTLSLLSELNATRTGEEITKIKDQVENNERIHADFGGPGVLFPTRGGRGGSWNSTRLDFLHHKGCSIMGHSMQSAQRGRGPLFGVLDDPEDDDQTYNKEYRQWFFDKLLSVYKPMFHYGGKFIWIGTPIHAGSCLSIAMRGMTEKDGEDNAGEDPRLKGWRKSNFAVIQSDGQGGWMSHQPDRISVAGFLTKLEIDPITTRKEILCLPTTPGSRAFAFHPHKHGYFHGVDSNGEYFLDLHTGERMPWKKFLSGLRIFGAGDQADGQSADSDYGACAWIGVSAKRVVYVLDCWNARSLVDDQIRTAYRICEELECGVMAWERTSLQCVINRMTKRYVDALRARGKAPPRFVEVENAKKNKVRRILTMSPLFVNAQIRFPQSSSIKDERTGEILTSFDYPRRGMMGDLISQVREYTDSEKGLCGPDDVIDALEMAIRIAADSVGEVVLDDVPETMEQSMERWEKLGLTFTRNQIPVQHWSPKMHEEEEVDAYQAYADFVMPFE